MGKDECPICFEPLNKEILITDCGHTFHEKCVSGLETCPICRSTIGDLILKYRSDYLNLKNVEGRPATFLWGRRMKRGHICYVNHDWEEVGVSLKVVH